MRPLSKKHTNELNAMFDRVLSAAGIVLADDNTTTIETKYGRISICRFDDWIAFRLLDFSSRYPDKWRGFDHWKQNFHTLVIGLQPRERSQAIAELGVKLRQHLKRLGVTFRDETRSIGYTYPTSPDAKRFGFHKTGCYVVTIGKEETAMLSAADSLVLFESSELPIAFDSWFGELDRDIERRERMLAE